MSTPRRSRAKPWTYSAGQFPHTVTASERIDRGRVIEVRWWDGKLGRYTRRSLHFSIRDEHGAIVDVLEQGAVRVTEACAHELRLGHHLTPDEVGRLVQRLAQGRVVLGDVKANAQTETAPALGAAPPIAAFSGRAAPTPAPAARPSEDHSDTGRLSLSTGFALAMAVPSGMYVTETEHLQDSRRAARDILATIGATQDDPPRLRDWNTLAYRDVRALWTGLAKRYVESSRGGPEWTTKCVRTVLQVGRWLATEGHVDHVLAMRPTWREQMHAEWEQITGSRVTVKKPRHSEDEVRRIFAALTHPKVDPRIKLAVVLGAEARLGQVRRLMRSHIDLSAVGGFGLGRVVVHGKRKKRGVHRDLTPEERAAIDEAHAGYLHDLEADYQEGRRNDYPVFPTGRLRLDFKPSRAPRGYRGPPPVLRAKRSVSNAPMWDRTLQDLFHALERIAGVTPVKGRGWYGVRRRLSDVYEDHEQDQRILNDQTGHLSSETRQKYQDPEDERIRARSAETRRRVRAAIAEGARVTEQQPPASGEAPASHGEGERVADPRAALRAPKSATHTPTHTPAHTPPAISRSARVPGRRM